MNKPKVFKVFCDPIMEVISVRIITSDKLEKYRAQIIHVLSNTSRFDFAEYYTQVVKDFVVDGEDLLNRLKEASSQVQKEIEEVYGKEDEVGDYFMHLVEAVYGSVIQVYPPLSLDNIVNIHNQDRIKGFLEDYLSELYDTKPNTVQKSKERATPRRASLPERDTQKSNKISNIQDIKNLEKNLRKEVIGQDEAIDTVIRTVKLMAANLAHNCSLMFIGPTGVGKTKLARELGNAYSGNFFKINCSEFAQPHEYAKLIGSPPGYIGSNEKSILEIKAEQSNRWVLLFDEIEKANPKMFDFMLALMDDGKIMASNGKELDFSDSIILMTSNEGIRDLQVGSKKLGFSGEIVSYDGSKDKIIESLKKKFSPEFLGRLDDMVYFKQLSGDDLIKVAKLELKSIPVRKTKALLSYIVSEGTSPEYGARFISKFITREVKSILADHILEGKKPLKGNLYEIKVKNNKLEL